MLSPEIDACNETWDASAGPFLPGHSYPAIPTQGGSVSEIRDSRSHRLQIFVRQGCKVTLWP